MELKGTKPDEKEHQLNLQYLGEQAAAFFPGADIMNHRFPKETDDEHLIFDFDFKMSSGYLLFQMNGKYKKGEEVGFAYTETLLNSEILGKYGVAIKGNMKNAVILTLAKAELEFNPTPSKKRLCEKALCFPPISFHRPDIVQYYISRIVNFANSLANYHRIRFLSENMASRPETVTQLQNNGYISFYNEVSALLDLCEFIELISTIKRKQSEDEADFREHSEWLKNGHSKYTQDQILDRMNALTAAIDEKSILSLQIILNLARIEDLLAKTVNTEISKTN